MRKKSIAAIRSQIEAEGYMLLTDTYVNAHSKLEIKCPNGHVFYKSINKWEKGQRCKYCNGALTHIDDIRKSFISENYTLLTTVYTGQQPLEYICPNGHRGTITLKHWNKGTRCRECYFDSISSNLDDFIKLLSLENYTVKKVLDNYTNSKSDVICVCPNGHIQSTSRNKWLNGYRCKECAYEELSNTFRLDFSTIKNSFISLGYTLLSTESSYKNALSMLKFICPFGHQGQIKWRDWQQGCRCSMCSNAFSKGHQNICDLIKSLDINYTINDRTIIKPYELDIVIPEKKLAIEYCGLYWHSEKTGKDKNYHLNKLKSCEKEGYRLITIFEDEWLKYPDIVKSRLTNLLAYKKLIQLHARKCIIKEIDYNMCKDFLNKNHIQQQDRSAIRLGAFYEENLVSVMTFCSGNIAKGSRKVEGVYELSRFCSKLGYNIPGIASKLLKYFERNYSWNEIFSYADRRWSDGGLYLKLGFTFVGFTQANYWYSKDGKDRIHRFRLRKTAKDDKFKTERVLRQEEGYYRVWDCGNFKFTKVNR